MKKLRHRPYGCLICYLYQHNVREPVILWNQFASYNSYTCLFRVVLTGSFPLIAEPRASDNSARAVDDR
jgi:hypothetical protein